MENVHILANYQEVFGEKLPEVSDVMGREVSVEMLSTLSMLSWKNNVQEISQWVLKNLSLTEAGNATALNRSFTTKSSSKWLWLYALNNFAGSEDVTKGQRDRHFERVIRSLTILNKKEIEKENAIGYLMNNGLDFYRDNYFWQINRTMRSLVNEKRMKKYASEFYQFHNVKLTDYMELHSHLARRFNDGASQLSRVTPEVWIVDLDDLAKGTRLASAELEKIMRTCSFSIDEFRANASDFEDENNWSAYLRKHPYFRVSDKKYIPVSGTFAENLLYNEIFHKIKDSSSNPIQFMGDYGHCFEDYISNLIKLACQKSYTHNYKYLPEFKYDANSKSSSDAYIYFRDERLKQDVVIVIEMKAKRIREQARVINPSKKDIQISIDKTIREPLNQALSVTCDIIKSGASKVLTKDKVYYFMSVSMDGYTGVFDDFDLTLNPKLTQSIKFGGVFATSIEGFECFIRVLMSNYAISANAELNEFNAKNKGQSFKTQMARISNNKLMNSFEFDDYINRSVRMTVNNFYLASKKK